MMDRHTFMCMSIFPEEIETERLILRRLCRDNYDIYEIHEHYEPDDSDQSSFADINVSPHTSIKETHELLVDAEEQWSAGDLASYILHLKSSGSDEQGAIIGGTALNPDWDRRSATMGIRLDPQYWGHGYSGERAEALLDLSFNRLDLELVAAEHIRGNTKAKRSIEKYVEKFGGQFDGTIRNGVVKDGEPKDKDRYTISKTEFLHSRS